MLKKKYKFCQAKIYIPKVYGGRGHGVCDLYETNFKDLKEYLKSARTSFPRTEIKRGLVGKVTNVSPLWGVEELVEFPQRPYISETMHSALNL